MVPWWTLLIVVVLCLGALNGVRRRAYERGLIEGATSPEKGFAILRRDSVIKS